MVVLKSIKRLNFQPLRVKGCAADSKLKFVLLHQTSLLQVFLIQRWLQLIDNYFEHYDRTTEYTFSFNLQPFCEIKVPSDTHLVRLEQVLGEPVVAYATLTGLVAVQAARGKPAKQIQLLHPNSTLARQIRLGNEIFINYYSGEVCRQPLQEVLGFKHRLMLCRTEESGYLPSDLVVDHFPEYSYSLDFMRIGSTVFRFEDRTEPAPMSQTRRTSISFVGREEESNHSVDQSLISFMSEVSPAQAHSFVVPGRWLFCPTPPALFSLAEPKTRPKKTRQFQVGAGSPFCYFGETGARFSLAVMSSGKQVWLHRVEEDGANSVELSIRQLKERILEVVWVSPFEVLLLDQSKVLFFLALSLGQSGCVRFSIQI